MSHRTIFSLAASVIIGIGCIATISTDAFAYRGGRVGVGRAGVHHAGVYRGGVYRGAAVSRVLAVSCAVAGGVKVRGRVVSSLLLCWPMLRPSVAVVVPS